MWRLPLGSACLTLFEALGPWWERGSACGCRRGIWVLRASMQEPHGLGVHPGTGQVTLGQNIRTLCLRHLIDKSKVRNSTQSIESLRGLNGSQM